MSGHTDASIEQLIAEGAEPTTAGEVVDTIPRLFRDEAITLVDRYASRSHADLVKVLEEIAAIEPVEGKAAKNRGAMVHMQSIASAALATLTARKVG